MSLYFLIPQYQEPIGIVFIVHGFHEHSSRPGYAYLASLLTDQGFIVYAHDHQGHGQSNGDEAYFTGIFSLRDHAIEIVETLSKTDKLKNLPVFLWGHSMGGLISDLIAIERPDLLTGMVLSAPAIKLEDEKLNFVNVHLSPILSKFFPKVWFPEGVDVEKVTRSEEARRRYVEDPMCYTHGYLRIRSGCSIMQGTFYAQEHTTDVITPMLIMHGTDDKVCDIKGSEMLFKQANSTDKQYIKMTGVYHEVYEDPDRDIWLPKGVEWLRTRAFKVSESKLFQNTGLRRIPVSSKL